MSKVNGLVQAMFTNPGKKIQTITKILYGICTVAAIVCGIYLATRNSYNTFLGMYLSRGDQFIMGIAMIILGPIVMWVLSLSAYAFGQLVENTAEAKALLAKADAERNNK